MRTAAFALLIALVGVFASESALAPGLPTAEKISMSDPSASPKLKADTPVAICRPRTIDW